MAKPKSPKKTNGERNHHSHQRRSRHRVRHQRHACGSLAAAAHRNRNQRKQRRRQPRKTRPKPEIVATTRAPILFPLTLTKKSAASPTCSPSAADLNPATKPKTGWPPRTKFASAITSKRIAPRPERRLAAEPRPPPRRRKRLRPAADSACALRSRAARRFSGL